VTLLRTKSIDFRQNYLCDFHLWFSEEPACDAQQQPEAIRGGRQFARPLLQLHPRGIEDGLEVEGFFFDKNLEKNFCKMLAIETGKSFGKMRSNLVVRATDCQCQSRNSPGFDPSILRHS
jgi:hypothetical protein